MRLKIKDQRKFNRFILLSVLLVILFTFFFSTWGSHPFVEGKSEETITVRYGDTLWDIAKDIDSDKDLREIVYEIKELNNIHDSNVYPGDEIIIPTY